MALVLLDRAKETTIVLGTTANAILLGAAPGYQSLVGVGNGNTTYYCIADQGGGLNWEVGLGTYTSATTIITRAATPLSSSNAGASVSFPAGTKDVFVVYPSSKGVWLDGSGNAIGLGTPAAFVGTNITGTAAGLTAGTVTTNANLTGDITSVGNATTLTNAPVIAKVLTGYVSGAGTVTATDSILQAIQKLNGNDATNANLTGMVTSVGNATTVVTNANLTGAVTSVGNATSLGSFTSAQLATALTDETGTGASVFATSPTLVTPALGTPVSGNLINCTMPTGSVLQVVNYQTGALITGTTLLPADNTIPQKTEGFEVMTLAITPKFATSMLIIQSVAQVSVSVAGAYRLQSALFQDTTANALAASSMWADSSGQCQSEQIINHKMTSGTTAATTFKIRVGSQAAATLSFNGSGGVGLFGAVMASSITIWEIAA